MLMNHTTNEHIDVFKHSSDIFNHKIERMWKEERYKKSHGEKFNSLTRREEEILSLVVSDFSNIEIAEILYISRFTVEQHRKNINRKLGLNSAIQLYRFALAFDMV